MSGRTHRTIKTLAIIFAVAIICSIFAGCIKGIIKIGHYVSLKHSDSDVSKVHDNIYEGTNEFQKFKIDVKYSEVTVTTGDKYSVDTNNKYVKVTTSEGCLEVKERKHSTGNGFNSKINITVPQNTHFISAEIDAGAGNLNIDSLSADNLEIDMGAGNLDIETLNTQNGADIDTGAGNLCIKSGTINNLELDMDVGETEINAQLLGYCDFDTSVGALKLNVFGNDDDYNIIVNKGIGEITVNGNTVHNNSSIGHGSNKIRIDGGIGETNINFINKENLNEKTV